MYDLRVVVDVERAYSVFPVFYVDQLVVWYTTGKSHFAARKIGKNSVILNETSRSDDMDAICSVKRA